jgi:hypothetical protein
MKTAVGNQIFARRRLFQKAANLIRRFSKHQEMPGAADLLQPGVRRFTHH